MIEMTVDEMRAESREIFEELQKQRCDDLCEEGGDKIAELNKRWRALDAEVHRRMMEDKTLEGAIYRAEGGFPPTQKRTFA